MQEGIKVDGIQLYGTISLISGDNLGSNLLGGFKAPSGAYRKCRNCMATAEDMKSKVCAVALIS